LTPAASSSLSSTSSSSQGQIRQTRGQQPDCFMQRLASAGALVSYCASSRVSRLFLRTLVCAVSGRHSRYPGDGGLVPAYRTEKLRRGIRENRCSLHSAVRPDADRRYFEMERHRRSKESRESRRITAATRESRVRVLIKARLTEILRPADACDGSPLWRSAKLPRKSTSNFLWAFSSKILMLSTSAQWSFPE
jgi:hypothetical protein